MTITDAHGLSVTSTVGITVNQTAVSVVVSPASVVLPPGGSRLFTVAVKDQFGNAMGVGTTWSATAGSITAGGLYTAPTSPFTGATVQAVNGSASGTATVSMANLPPSDILLSNTAIDENQTGATVGTLTSADPNQGETFTYALLSDPTGKFEIVGDTLKLKAGEALDYEATPTVALLIRTTDSGNLSFQKPFALAVGDLPEMLVVGESDWTAAGLTLQLSDGKLHVYRTGDTADAVPPHNPANVLGIDVTGRGLGDVMTAAATGTGIAELAIHRATLLLGQEDALSAGMNVTIDGGMLDFDGHAAAIGNLFVRNDGRVTGTAIDNNATTVESGTLTAFSIVCDTLTIGSDFGTAGSSSPAVIAGTALSENTEKCLATITIAPMVGESEANSSLAGALPLFLAAALPDRVLSISGETVSVPVPIFRAIDETAPFSSAIIRLEENIVAASSSTIVSSAATPASQLVQDTSTRMLENASAISPLQTPSYWLPAFEAFRLKSAEDHLAALISAKWLDDSKFASCAAKQDEPALAGSDETRPTGARNGGQYAASTALRSAIRDYGDWDSGDQLDASALHRNHSPKQTSRFAKAVDAVLAEDGND